MGAWHDAVLPVNCKNKSLLLLSTEIAKAAPLLDFAENQWHNFCYCS
jgi:hypothetical protein